MYVPPFCFPFKRGPLYYSFQMQLEVKGSVFLTLQQRWSRVDWVVLVHRATTYSRTSTRLDRRVADIDVGILRGISPSVPYCASGFSYSCGRAPLLREEYPPRPRLRGVQALFIVPVSVTIRYILRCREI